MMGKINIIRGVFDSKLELQHARKGLTFLPARPKGTLT